VNFSISNDTAELPRMTHWLVHAAGDAGLPEELIGRLETCAYEAAINIMAYAYTDSARHDITFVFSALPGGARLVIRDDGRPFNPLEFVERPQPASVAEAEIGGLGIRLIRRLMTHCAYRRDGDFNELTLEAGPAPTHV
jgi:anti-sigma regulatory factor (Ser/Thr protein kinase)